MKVDVVVIGAGSTGLFTALDLTLRGAKVAVIDRQGISRGTSGRFHGMLHSGARYAVGDKAAAKECSEESAVLARVAPHAVFDHGSYFVAFEGDDDSYVGRFREALDDTGIEHREEQVSDLLRREPAVNSSARCAIAVPDRVADPFKLLASVAHMAWQKGAKFLLYRDVTELDPAGKVTMKGGEVDGTAIVNAAGPWAGQVASLGGIELGIMPTIGVMLVYRPRLSNVVLNRLRPPSDGDIILPYYETSILGTTAQVVEDFEDFAIEEADLRDLVHEGSKMIPGMASKAYSRYYYSARPLQKGLNPRETSRDFQIIEKDNLVTILAGKLTTSRLIAEKVSDLVAKRIGLGSPCTTREIRLDDVLQKGGPFAGTIAEEMYNLGPNLISLERELNS